MGTAGHVFRGGAVIQHRRQPAATGQPAPSSVPATWGGEHMVSRRDFMSMTAAALAAPGLAAAQQPNAGKVALYTNVGADLTHYDVDVDGMALIPRETVTLPASVQYAW